VTQDTTGIAFDRHDVETAIGIAGELADLWQAVYADRADDPFVSREQFLYRLGRYQSAPRYTLITAREDGRLVGFAYGYPLPADSRWWDGVTPPPPEGFADQTGRRTFAVNDIVVSADRRRRGIARTMHDRLKAEHPGMRFTLATEPGNATTQAIYSAWGYRLVGRAEPPFPDAPPLDLMVLEP
jgi:ribosomal protein S18 acetylase RimI-like enzyme